MKNATKKNFDFYKGKRVLITGHTGFKGAWLSSILYYLQANIVGYALSPQTNSLYDKIQGDNLLKSVIGDLLDREKLKKTILEFQPEIVIHLAAFAFVKDCFDDPIRAYETNLMGSVNLLETLRDCKSVKSIVMISTDKVYKNEGDGECYKETDQLGDIGPYSISKTCMEYMIEDYKKNYFDDNVGIAIVRASNVLGGGDHIQTRLIPTILNSIANGNSVELRNSDQTRPWQSVFDALNGYLTIGRLLYMEPLKYSESWNIGPKSDGIRSVEFVFETIKKTFNNLQSTEGKKFDVAESKTLGLDIQKSLKKLDWEPILSIEKTIYYIVDFFKSQCCGENERDICLRQISEFFKG